MRIIIIGAVAAGTSAAAKARRNTESAEIVVYEKDWYISYSGCGMPYHLGGVVKDSEDLHPRDPAFFKKKYNVDIRTGHEVLAIDPREKTLKVRDIASDRVFTDSYDKLVLATGAKAFLPPIPGAKGPGVFTLRTMEDLYRLKDHLKNKDPRHAVILGSGFIGLEVAENLKARGMEVTILEMLPQVTPGLDPDMAFLLEEHLRKHGVTVRTGVRVAAMEEDGMVLDTGEKVRGDLMLVATGVRPRTELAKAAGVVLGETGAISVNARMETSIPDIYACGDCIEVPHGITGKPVWRPLGSTANKTGRIAGENLSGGSLLYRGTLGTGIFKAFDLAVGQSGLSEREALLEGYDIAVSHNLKPHRPEYLGGKEMVIKAVADRRDGRLLGVQIVGPKGVDKRLDVFVTAMSFQAKVEDLFHLDLGYAPPFSTTKDPVMYTGMILTNHLENERRQWTARELLARQRAGEDMQILDTRSKEQFDEGHVEGAVHLPHAKVREALKDLDPDRPVLTYCNKGTTGNAVQNILLNQGFKEVYSLSGGYRTYARYRLQERE